MRNPSPEPLVSSKAQLGPKGHRCSLYLQNQDRVPKFRSWVFVRSMFWILALYLDFEGAKNIHVLKVLIWAFEDAGGSWLGFGILILILIWSLDFYLSIFQVLALYPDFEDAKNIHVIQVLICGFGGWCRFLTGVWHFDLDFYIVIGLLYTHNPNIGSLSSFWRCKEHHCPVSSYLGL